MRGVTYVAWGRGIPPAEQSAQSAKRFGLQTCLIANEYDGAAFDQYVQTDQRLTCPAEKAFAYHLSPWDETLYLDTDTTILGDLSFGFDMARRHGIALVIAPACFVRLHWRNLDRFGVKEIHPDMPDYNGGVIFFYRDHSATKELWPTIQRELSEKVDWSSQSGNPDLNDQSALSLILYQNGINPYVLPQNWNLRVLPREWNMRILGYGPIKIWHSSEPIPEGFDAEQTSVWFV